MSNIEIAGDFILVKEENTHSFKSRYFVKFLNKDSLIHISALPRKAIREVVFDKGSVEYVIDRGKLPKVVEIYEAALINSKPRILLYRIDNDKIEVPRKAEFPLVFSSGFPTVDKLVNEVKSYRRIWTRILCNGLDHCVDLYGAFLSADLSLIYALFHRLKEAWLELSNEYVGFVFSLVHAVLKELELDAVDKEVLLEKCNLVEKYQDIYWRSTSIRYSKLNSNLEVSVERMISGVTPDLIISTNNKKIVIECKQGPPKTWLAKSIKQAQKYREVAQQLILVTSRELDENEQRELSKYYNYVIDQCNGGNYVICRNRIKNVILNQLSR
ncbi:MAG: hypothetical protein QXS24_01570 [Desulfurococcaceae archaeon]